MTKYYNEKHDTTLNEFQQSMLIDKNCQCEDICQN